MLENRELKIENTYEMDNPAAAEDGIEAMELDWTTDWINQLQSLITNPDADSSSIFDREHISCDPRSRDDILTSIGFTL